MTLTWRREGRGSGFGGSRDSFLEACSRGAGLLQGHRPKDRPAGEFVVNTAAVLAIGHALLESYDRLKSIRGLLDYDDLITKAAALLSNKGGVSWVHYKLDGGIDHILVDEAQDTSPAQWRVIAQLAGDFFAGLSRMDPEAGAPRWPSPSDSGPAGAPRCCSRRLGRRVAAREIAGQLWRSRARDVAGRAVVEAAQRSRVRQGGATSRAGEEGRA